MPNLQTSYNWAIQVCNQPNVGYSQDYREGQVVDGITYYDCSSFISAALTAGGFFDTNPWFDTSVEPDYLLGAGFVQYETSVPWQPGDIVWRDGHTEMVYQGYRTMGAHSANLPLDDQVSIEDTETDPSTFTNLYRYPGGLTYEWVSKNAYLSQSEMENNVHIIYNYFSGLGWTDNAIAAILGNMQQESTINPGLWQNLRPNRGGFGLVQWTPYTKYTEWADQNGYEWGDGDGQLYWIQHETTPTGEWIETDGYELTFEEFQKSTQTVDYLTRAYLYNFERAGNAQLENRLKYAAYWYDYIQNIIPGPGPAPRAKKFKWIFYMKRRF